jgi:UDP-glucose 4-epimerase
MRVLITGASGFLGSHLVRRLAGEGHAVAVLPSPFFRANRLSGVRFEVAARAGDARAEVVYHLAGTPLESAVADAEHARVIVGGAAALVDQLRRYPPRRLVVAGSAAEYGSGHRWREEDEPRARPDTVFGRLKQEAWDLFRHSGLEAVELRIFTPYGEGESERRLVPSAITAAFAGVPFRLRSTGCQTRDYCYVGDVTGAFVAAGERAMPAGTIVNISTGVERTVCQAARRVVELAGGRGETVETGAEEPASLQQLSGNPERARLLLGWTPKVGFDEGIRRTIAWRKERQAA